MGKLVKVDPSAISIGISKRADNLHLLEEFMAMDVSCVEYIGYPQKSSAICQASILQSAKLYGFYSIGVIRRGDHVYLIRKDLIGKMKS